MLDAVDEQLSDQPDVETRHRKPLRPNPVAPWEFRIGDLRVFYDYDEPNEVVTILAVGIKRHNALFIGDEEVTL